MRFSAAFDPPVTVRTAPLKDRAPAAPLLPSRAPAAASPEPVPEDLDQRVREVGEWQLEDW